MVLRAPNGEPSAEFIRVGASRTVQTTKHRTPAVKAFFQPVESLRGGPPPRRSSDGPTPEEPAPPASPESSAWCSRSKGSSVRTVTPGRAEELPGELLGGGAEAEAEAGRRSRPDLPAAAPRIACAFPPAPRMRGDPRPFEGARLSAETSGISETSGTSGASGNAALRRRREEKGSVNVDLPPPAGFLLAWSSGPAGSDRGSEISESEVDEGLHALGGERRDTEKDPPKYGALCHRS